jgi:hypothetical protein
VHGDLTLDAGVQGSGAIVVDGTLSIRGASSAVNATDNVALLASGPISIKGKGPAGQTATRDANIFQGLVYSQQHITANDITVLGNMVGQGTNTTKLRNVKIVGNPQATTINVTSPPVTALGTLATGPVMSLGGNTTGTQGNEMAVMPYPGGTVVNGSLPPTASDTTPILVIGTPSNYPGVGSTQQQQIMSNINVVNPAALLVNASVSGQLLIDPNILSGSAPQVSQTLQTFLNLTNTTITPPPNPSDPNYAAELATYQFNQLSIANVLIADWSNPATAASPGSPSTPLPPPLYNFSINTFMARSASIRTRCYKIYGQRL